MQFIVKPHVDITKYGFILKDKDGTSVYIWFRKNKFGRGGVNMHYCVIDRRITVQSASSDCIAVLCEMYKNGDLEMVPEKAFINMKLTEEEVKIIKERRKANSCGERNFN